MKAAECLSTDEGNKELLSLADRVSSSTGKTVIDILDEKHPDPALS